MSECKKQRYERNMTVTAAAAICYSWFTCIWCSSCGLNHIKRINNNKVHAQGIYFAMFSVDVPICNKTHSKKRTKHPGLSCKCMAKKGSSFNEAIFIRLKAIVLVSLLCPMQNYSSWDQHTMKEKQRGIK